MKTKTTLPFIFILLFTCFNLFGQDANELKLKDYRPVSIYKTPQAKIEKARYPAIDFHSHDYPKTDAELDEWVKTMDEKGHCQNQLFYLIPPEPGLILS